MHNYYVYGTLAAYLAMCDVFGYGSHNDCASLALYVERWASPAACYESL